MKKLFLISVLFIALGAKSQDFYHGLGGGILVGTFTQEYTTPFSNVSSTGGAYVPGIMYKATLGFDISRKTSFGVTASPFLGFFLSSQQGSYFGFQLPVMGEYYFGDIDDNCFYLGGGFSYGLLDDGSVGGSVLGPVLGLGAQFEVRDVLYGLRANYTLGVNKERDVPADWEYTKDSRGMISLSAYLVF